MGKDVYQITTERVIKRLEEGVIPWQTPLRIKKQGWPRNLTNDRHYNGLNVFMLACAGYGSPYWLTLNQANELGGKIKKGEKSSIVTYYKVYDKTTGPGEDDVEKRFVLRYYNVFNVEQTEGIQHKRLQQEEWVRGRVSDMIDARLEFTPLEECELVVKNMPQKPVITTRNGTPCYIPSLDEVRMPLPQMFNMEEEYYCTFFHELTHSTGHESRLKRKTVLDMPQTNLLESYSKEELVAEMGAAFLCGITGIQNRTIANSASYIGGWLKKLKDDPKLVIQAAGQAQRAVKFITNDMQKQESE